MSEHSKAWVMRTYSGHSTAVKSNELYRSNIAKGQTGLSIAFDLPTQTGYDPDSQEAEGEVGKVGVAVSHLGHMRQLLDGIALEQMNTSMTINATAAWLWALYIALGEELGVPLTSLQGTTQNDIVKEYLSRGTYIFAPEPSKRLIVDMIAYGINNVPKWNPINVCSYHLQEAGATPVQEIAYALATAIDVLDAVRDSGKVTPEQMPHVVGRISFFVNGGVRFIEEIAKMRTFTAMWDEIVHPLRGSRPVAAPVPLRRPGQFARSHRTTTREQRATHRARDARSHLVRRCASTRHPTARLERGAGAATSVGSTVESSHEQVLAFESDLLEYPDIFAGSQVMDAKVHELTNAAKSELD